MILLLSILTILAAALSVAVIALALTFMVGPIYRASLPRDYTAKYEPSGQTHLSNYLM